MDGAAGQSLSERTANAIREALAGRRRGVRAVLPFAGPAVIASVAYMDPGNFATNIQAGAAYGYDLLWVVLLANVVAMLFQAMSAKIGIVTNRNLAELCRLHFSRPVVVLMWIVSEIAAMATDLAEFLGGAIGLSLLFQMPLLWGMAATAIVTYAIVAMEGSGFRPIELIIGGLVVVIGVCYLVELAVAPPDWSAALLHSAVPHLNDPAAVTLSVGIIGATVMPHAIYLHSALTQRRFVARDDAERRSLLRYSNREVVAALGLAGLVNMAMVMMAAAAFHAGHSDVGEIETAYYTLVPLLGIGAAGVFLLSLMASGISSSAVGTMAGQVIMQGFIGVPIPLWVKSYLDDWTAAARITGGRVLRPVRKNGDIWGRKLTQNVIWYTVRLCASRAGINNLAGAVKMLRAVNRSNAGLMIDMHHFHRARDNPADLDAVPREWFHFAHLCDAPAEIPTERAEMIRILREARLYVGEGGIDVASIVAHLPRCVYSIELPNKERHDEIGYAEHATRCLETLKAYLAEHRGDLGGRDKRRSGRAATGNRRTPAALRPERTP